MRPGSGRVLLAGCSVVLLANVWLLAFAAWNRLGEPAAELSLTERELALVADDREEHGGLLLSFRLTSRLPHVVRRAGWVRRHEFTPLELPWLDRDKLEELGFAVDVDPEDPNAEAYYARKPLRRAYLALEFEGPAWERWMEDREHRLEQLRRDLEAGSAGAESFEDAQALLDLDRAMRSRLFPVDAGTDAAALGRRYSDRTRYAVVEGLVRPRIVRGDDDIPILTGVVEGPIPGQVNVPLEHRAVLEPFLPDEPWRERREKEREEARAGWPAPVPPRYRVVVAFGRNHEPWLTEVETLGR